MHFYYTGKYIYSLNILNSVESSAGYSDTPYNMIFWQTDSIVGGKLTILNFDTINQIISGTFYFDCVDNKGMHDTIHITDGSFDLKYKRVW